MLLEDLETFCGDASPSTKIVALKRMLQSLGRNGFDFEVSQRFHEICSIIFSAEGKPLLTDPKVAEDMVSLLKFDENSATSLPVILQKTIHQTRGFLVNSNSSPYFIIAPNKLRPHTQNLLNHGEIELLPSFIRNRLHETEEKNESTILTTSDRIPNYEIRLDILEYYFYWFINFPHNQKQLVESSHLKESSKSKPTSSTPHWVKFLSPKKQTTKKTKLKTTNVYAELLKNYLEHFIPYEISGRNKTPSTFLEMIITSWFDYGNTPTHRKENIHDNIEIPSKACLEAIKVVVTYAVSDPALKEAGKNGDEYTIAGAPCRDIQKPLYDFLCASYSILSDAQPSHIHNLLFDIWMTFTLPWNSHKEKKELKQLSDNWILFIKQNILVYLTPTRKFLEYARMNFNTAAKEQDLQLFEKFVSNFLNLDLYKHIRDSVATLNDVKSGGLYTNQTVDRAIIQRHCGSMDVNICQLTDLEELFTKEKNSLPLTILQNLSSDIMYCYKYLPDISQVSRIEKLAENFATIFGLESKWQDIKPRGRSGRRVKSTERHKVSKNSRHRLLEVDLSADYWQAPLMTFENAMAARFAYRLAVKLRDNYEMEELPHIRWLASYKIWGLTLFCMFLLYVMWRIAVLLAHLLSA